MSLFLVALAVLVYPDGASRDRLRQILVPKEGRTAWLRRRAGQMPTPLLAPLCVGVIGLVAAGPFHAIAGALLAATIAHLRERTRVRRARLETLAAWECALDDAASALRAGLGTEGALEQAAHSEAAAPVSKLLLVARSHARLGGDVAGALRSSTDSVAVDLAGAWSLATRHGVLLADVVAGLRVDVAADRNRAVRVEATLAGPRATALILTALPAFGVVLGSGFGADPLRVLLGNGIGGVLCLVGAGFLAAGLLWTDRIVAGAGQ